MPFSLKNKNANKQSTEPIRKEQCSVEGNRKYHCKKQKEVFLSGRKNGTAHYFVHSSISRADFFHLHFVVRLWFLCENNCKLNENKGRKQERDLRASVEWNGWVCVGECWQGREHTQNLGFWFFKPWFGANYFPKYCFFLVKTII